MSKLDKVFPRRRVSPSGAGPASGVTQNVLFLRDFRGFSGGHLKVWNYYSYVLGAPRHRPWIRFTRETVWDATNPWYRCREGIVGRRMKVEPDILFIAGTDWLNLTRKEQRRQYPVINLIQHVWHADPGNVRFQFLARRAIRICVSQEVTDAISSTGLVNGPVFTIPNAVDVEMAAHLDAPERRDIDLLVVANKRPELGRRVCERLAAPGRELRLLDRTLARDDFLRCLLRARVTVFVPNPTEGFYLPALEGMALGTLVVCPDCVGNRSFCLPGTNCFRPRFSEDHLVEEAEAALLLPMGRTEEILREARATAAEHDRGHERDTFLEILDDVETLWAKG